MNTFLPSVRHILRKQWRLPSRMYSVFEPDYLKASDSDVPSYDTLNLQLKGYDFPILESYGSFVHKTAERLGINVEDSWATPRQDLSIQTYKPQSAAIESEYKLHVYERNVQITDLQSTTAPIFFEILQTALPSGVKLHVQPHEQQYEDIRYIPDLELKKLKIELDELSKPKK